jgi:hypothetical protein
MDVNYANRSKSAPHPQSKRTSVWTRTRGRSSVQKWRRERTPEAGQHASLADGRRGTSPATGSPAPGLRSPAATRTATRSAVIERRLRSLGLMSTRLEDRPLTPAERQERGSPLEWGSRRHPQQLQSNAAVGASSSRGMTVCRGVMERRPQQQNRCGLVRLTQSEPQVLQRLRRRTCASS